LLQQQKILGTLLDYDNGETAGLRHATF